MKKMCSIISFLEKKWLNVLWISILLIFIGCDDPGIEIGTSPTLSVGASIGGRDFENVIPKGSTEDVDINVAKGEKIFLIATGHDQGGVKRVTISVTNGFIIQESDDDTGLSVSTHTISEEDAKTVLLNGGYIIPSSESVTRVELNFEAEDLSGRVGAGPRLIFNINEVSEPEPIPDPDPKQEDPKITKLGKSEYLPGENVIISGENLEFGTLKSYVIFKQGTKEEVIEDISPNSRRLEAVLPVGFEPGSAFIKVRVGSLESMLFDFEVKGRVNGEFEPVVINVNNRDAIEEGDNNIQVSPRGTVPQSWTLSIRNTKFNTIVTYSIADQDGFNVLVSKDKTIFIVTTIDPTPPRDNRRRLAYVHDLKNMKRIGLVPISSCQDGCRGPEDAKVQNYKEVYFKYDGKGRTFNIY